MMLVFQERKVRQMLKYSDITKRFVEFTEAERGYWDRLQGAAGQLSRDFESSLDLPAQAWIDDENKPNKYVELGVFTNGSFKPTSFMALPGDGDLSLNFALKVTLEEGPNVFPKSNVVQTFSIKEEGSVLRVTLHGNDDIVMTVRKEPIEGRFDDVIEAAKRRLLDILNTESFGS